MFELKQKRIQNFIFKFEAFPKISDKFLIFAAVMRGHGCGTDA